jgi:SAM domain (Sterile alpha motif)
MHQIADWLETLGMSEYTQRFAENDIDTSVLPHLSDQDLKELGIGGKCSRRSASLPARLRQHLNPSPPAIG